MDYCTTCNNYFSAEAFIYKGKINKTCSNCLDTRSKKRKLKKQSLSNNIEYENNELVYDRVSFTKIVEYISNKEANLGVNDILSFNLYIELDDLVLNTAHQDAKNTVKLIVDEIEGFDGYDWVFTTGPEMSLHHNGVDPIQLRIHLRQKFNILLTTNKQIHYWWSTYCQCLYKSDDNHIISTRNFFEGPNTKGNKLCFDWNTNIVTAIGFVTPLFFKLLSLSSFPIAYLTLNTTKAQNNEEQSGLQTIALTGFFNSLRDKGLQL
ncbi:6260_t:CDS:2 [Cetraspora pellucida]|uniref:6260_t:CDS:1 n=1 Tax=Cetraspora pellucida TaxID=1433469 RepID=A0A9N9GJJ1_9GLOM|nr:6260_t:CDS:2 [Cetraspora pellucida]